MDTTDPVEEAFKAARTELVRSRAFIRGAETQLTKALDQLAILDVALAARGRGDGPDPAVVPVPTEFERIGGEEVAGPGNIRIEVADPIGPPLAFPGAEGWGAEALIQSRAMVVANPGALQVLFVDNTNSSGAGSFRAALDACLANRYSIIIFRVGGMIDWPNQWVSPAGFSNSYIAGQTAPGGGICVRSSGTQSLFRISDRNNCAVRYLRFRHGNIFTNSDTGGCVTVTGSGGARDIIFDHLSTSWAGGSAHLSISKVANTGQNALRRISFIHCIAGETITNSNGGGGPRCVMFYDGNSDQTQLGTIYDVSLAKSLMLTAGQRLPRIATNKPGSNFLNDPGNGYQVVNNVIYSWQERALDTEGSFRMDFVKNYMKKGPRGPNTDSRWLRHRRYVNNNPSNPFSPASFMVDGNVLDGYGGPSDHWLAYRAEDNINVMISRDNERTERLVLPPYPGVELSAEAALDYVLANVGCNERVLPNGNWTANRDGPDLRMVGNVIDGTGLNRQGVSVEDHNGSWPSYAAGTPPVDSNGNGLPDAWESRFGISDPAFLTPSGYLAIECYVNGTHPETGHKLVA